MEWLPDENKSRYGPDDDYSSAFRRKIEDELTDAELQRLLLALALVSEQRHASMSSKPESMRR